MLNDVPRAWKSIVTESLLKQYVGIQNLPSKVTTEWKLLLYVIDHGTHESLDKLKAYLAHLHDGADEIPFEDILLSMEPSQRNKPEPAGSRRDINNQNQETVNILNQVAKGARNTSSEGYTTDAIRTMMAAPVLRTVSSSPSETSDSSSEEQQCWTTIDAEHGLSLFTPQGQTNIAQAQEQIGTPFSHDAVMPSIEEGSYLAKGPSLTPAPRMRS